MKECEYCDSKSACSAGAAVDVEAAWYMVEAQCLLLCTADAVRVRVSVCARAPEPV